MHTDELILALLQSQSVQTSFSMLLGVDPFGA